MNYIPALIIALLLILAQCTLGAVSTTKQGNFQAIAQSPCSIALYWKDTAPGTIIFCNDSAYADMISTRLQSGYNHTVISGLQPNMAYTFTLGENGPAVVEKTWCSLPDKAQFDLLIIGGTASGVSSAVTAARLGMRVALVEETNRLGGMASNGLGATDMRQQSRSSGFFEDYRRRVVEFYEGGTGLKYEPRVANAIIKAMVYEHNNICIFMKAKAVQPILCGNAVKGAVVQDMASGQCAEIYATITIDATYTADFTAAAGVEYRVGREARTESEPHAGLIYFNNSSQQILPGSTGQGDHKQQSYAYLMTWKDYGEAGAPLIEEPPFYDPENYRHSPPWTKTWNYTSGRLTANEYEVNQHPFGIDWPGINHEYPTASEERRYEIESMYKARALGYLYYFQNELGHTELGLADDEYLDSDNFPVSLYIREARRIVGEYVVNECDISNARSINRIDSIAIGDYPMDSHAVEELKDPEAPHKGEGEFWLVSLTPWYQVPYGVIIPKHIDGLLVTTAVSGTHVGYGTLRMEPVRMSLGQAAAATAYWSILYSRPPRTINPAWVQDKILSQYSYIGWNSDVNRETRHFKAINFLSARGIFTEEAMRPDKPLTREEAIIVLNHLLKLECFPQEMDIHSPAAPQDPVTREQFAQWLVEAKQKVSNEWNWIVPENPSYVDVPSDSSYYAAIETLKAHRIEGILFENTQPGEFKPKASISRADAAEAIYLAHRAPAMNYWRCPD